MRKAILDSSFILTCVKQKIDFFEELEKQGIVPIIPKQVLSEIERVSESNKKKHYKDDAKIALKIIEKEKENLKIINLGKKHVDKEIKKYAKEHPDIIIATLDKYLRESVENPYLYIRGKKILEIR
ncbi:MAG TPA: PIN domain-containing protein [Candidatus Nanoarchaeia archaeon]|nr:PIN domain-containing protein [Candidatus Nanoarchaeia archaeon]